MHELKVGSDRRAQLSARTSRTHTLALRFLFPLFGLECPLVCMRRGLYLFTAEGSLASLQLPYPYSCTSVLTED